MSQVAGVELNDIVRWIHRYRTERGYPPSRRDMTAEFGFSLQSSQRALDALIEEGLLTVTPKIPRGINITGAGMKIVSEKMS